MLMSTYLSRESRCDLEADGNVDLDNRLLDDEDDEEEEGMINADSCQRLESHENEAPEESLLEEKVARCKRLVELKQCHRALISNRRLSLCGVPQRLRASQMHARNDDENTRLSISYCWHLYISTLDPDFFMRLHSRPPTCWYLPAAAMEMLKYRKNAEEFSSLQNRASQGYSGLRINEHNNDDIAELFRKKCQAKAVRGQSISCYAQFHACVGQFARFCITLKLVEAEEICCLGTLLRLGLCFLYHTSRI